MTTNVSAFEAHVIGEISADAGDRAPGNPRSGLGKAAMFADLSGFTPLSEKLDAEELTSARGAPARGGRGSIAGRAR